MFKVCLTLSRVKPLVFDPKLLVLNVSGFMSLHEGIRRGKKRRNKGLRVNEGINLVDSRKSTRN